MEYAAPDADDALLAMYRQANVLLAHAMDKEFDAQARIGLELENRITPKEGEEFSERNIEKIERFLRGMRIEGTRVYRRFYKETQPAKLRWQPSPCRPASLRRRCGIILLMRPPGLRRAASPHAR